MKAVTVQPGVSGSVRFEEVPEPDQSTGSILVEAVAKAWELVAAMRARAFWEPGHALVTGAGPIGMLAALIGEGGPGPG